MPTSRHRSGQRKQCRGQGGPEPGTAGTRHRGELRPGENTKQSPRPDGRSVCRTNGTGRRRYTLGRPVYATAAAAAAVVVAAVTWTPAVAGHGKHSRTEQRANRPHRTQLAALPGRRRALADPGRGHQGQMPTAASTIHENLPFFS